jgi:hypothetical protein
MGCFTHARLDKFRSRCLVTKAGTRGSRCAVTKIPPTSQAFKWRWHTRRYNREAVSAFNFHWHHACHGWRVEFNSWMSEDYRMDIFDAVALALVFRLKKAR